jgi:hypothetical protein
VIRRLTWPRILVVAALVSFQAMFTLVPSVDRAAFEADAHEIHRTWLWRYGYVRQYHGAVLIATRMTDDASPLPPRDPDDDIAPQMLRNLESRPFKVAFEVGFYVFLWLLWRVGIVPARRRLAGEHATRWRRSAVGGLSWVAIATAALAPYLLAGYGEPLFSTLQGPGALSSSSMIASVGSVFGPALSYDSYLEVFVLWPLLCFAWVPWLAGLDVRLALWLMSAGAYGLVGAAMGLLPQRPATTSRFLNRG